MDEHANQAAAGGDVAAAASSRVRRAVIGAAGALLLAAAVFAVCRDAEKTGQAWEAARDAPAWMIVLALAMPLVNIAAVSLSFLVLTGRYGRVGIFEMMGLICSAWLLNMLPMRPGLLGRVGYHKAVNGIAVRDSVKVLVQAIACNGAAMACALGMAVIAAAMRADAWTMGAMLGAPGAVMGAAAAFMRSAGVGRGWKGLAAEPWRWPAAAALRYVDIIAWVGRYALAFALLGKPLTLVSATATALASEAAMLSPVQVGLREWVVGVTSAAFATEPDGAVSLGLMADLFNRGIELAVALPIGLAASGWLMGRARRAAARKT